MVLLYVEFGKYIRKEKSKQSCLMKVGWSKFGNLTIIGSQFAFGLKIYNQIKKLLEGFIELQHNFFFGTLVSNNFLH